MELIPADGVLAQLKCSLCANYLSHFPIYSTLKSTNTCGRCPTSDDTEVFHNEVFEKLSQFVRFPCMYKEEGCKDDFFPIEIPNHEKTCQWKKIHCPTSEYTECKWTGTKTSKIDHCRQHHNEKFLPNDKSFDLDTFYLIEHQNVLLIFKTKLTNDLKFKLYSTEMDTKSGFICEIIAKNSDDEVSMKFKNTGFDNQDYNVLAVNQSKIGTYKFKLVMKQSEDSVKNDILSIITCLSCRNLILPPIFECQELHNAICGNCVTTHKNVCVSCRQNNPKRNISLDKMAELLTYPCENSTCDYVGKPADMKTHQIVCTNRQWLCPFDEYENCQWMGLISELCGHIENDHQSLVPIDSLIMKKFVGGRQKIDILRYCGRLFRLVSMLELNEGDDKYMWSLQMIGNFEGGFYYEIEILDASGRRLIIRKPVGGFGNAFDNNDNFCYFWGQQLTDFIHDGLFKFKVRIFC